MEANSQVNTAVIDDLRGIETLKSLRVEERRYQEIEVKFHDYLKKSLSKAKWQLTQDGLKTGVQLVSNVFILWYGAQLVMEGQLSAGQLITYNMLLNYFTTPLINIINLQSKIQQAKVAIIVFKKFMLWIRKKKENLKSYLFKQLALKGVSHRFSYQQETLSKIDLTIHKGWENRLMG